MSQFLYISYGTANACHRPLELALKRAGYLDEFAMMQQEREKKQLQEAVRRREDRRREMQAAETLVAMQMDSRDNQDAAEAAETIESMLEHLPPKLAHELHSGRADVEPKRAKRESLVPTYFINQY